MLKENYLKKKLVSGKPVIGTWSIIPSVEVIDIIGSTGLDFIIIDRAWTYKFSQAQKEAIACESEMFHLL